MSKSNEIKKEYERLIELFENMPNREKALIEPLIDNAAFMKVELSNLQKQITEEGCSEQYKNGANQFGYKESAKLKAYNSLMRNFESLVTKLLKYVPDESVDDIHEIMAALVDKETDDNDY